MRRNAWIAAVLMLFGVIAAACAPPPPPPGPVSQLPIGTGHPIASRQVTFTDTSRSTPALDAFPGSDSRSIPTTIWYPTDKNNGPYPLVVFAPGYGVGPSFYQALLTQIAGAGYVVASPTYPILSGQPAGPNDIVDWAEKFPDTWYVTTKMLDLSASADPDLGGLIDPQRIAVAGHSDGAAIAFGDGYEPFRNDPRVRAVISYAADFTGDLYQPNGRPLLHFLSDNDVYNPYPQAIGWDRAHLVPPKYTVSLFGATHEGPYTDPADPHFGLVVRVTLDFLNSELKGHPELMLFAGLDVAANPSLGAME